MDQNNTELTQILTQIDLIKAKDIRELKDALRVLDGKINRLQPQGEQSETIGKITEAKAKAKIAAKPLKETGLANGSRYSTLDDYKEAYQGALCSNGLDITFTPQKTGESYVLITKLSHSSGEWFRSMLPLEVTENANARQNDDQKFGSTLSYMKRYAYAAIMGV